MYCPVYGCNSDSKVTKEVPFCRFPSGKSPDQQYRKKSWIEFCKCKAFKPSSNTRICSLHFAEDAFEPGQSPQFLERIQCSEKFRIQLKQDALPTLNEPLIDQRIQKSRRNTERRQQKKVIFIHLLCKYVFLKSKFNFHPSPMSSFLSLKEYNRPFGRPKAKQRR